MPCVLRVSCVLCIRYAKLCFDNGQQTSPPPPSPPSSIFLQRPFLSSESSVDPLWFKALYIGHWTHDQSIVAEWPRQATYSPIAKFAIASIDVATCATPIVGGASAPITPEAPEIMVLALLADPILLTPGLGKLSPCSTAHHGRQQVVLQVVSRTLLAGPHIFWVMLLRRLKLHHLLIRLALQSLRSLPHPSLLADQLEVLLDVLLCPVFCLEACAPPWHAHALCAWPWDATLDTGHSSRSGARCSTPWLSVLLASDAAHHSTT